jgi:hypothetical protein
MEIRAFGPFDLNDLVSKAPQKTQPRPVHEAQIMELQQAFARYERGCEFRPGDLVVPTSNAGQRYKGEPHIVLEVAETPHQSFEFGGEVGDVSSSSYGSRLDMRVAIVAENNGEHPLMAFWVESWQFLPYSPPD